MTDKSQVETPGAPAKPERRFNLALLIALAVAVLLAWQWFDTRSQFSALQQELSKRLAEAELFP